MATMLEATNGEAAAGVEPEPVPILPPFVEHQAKELESRLGPVLSAIDGARSAVQAGRPLPDLFGITAHLIAIRDAVSPRPEWIHKSRHATLVAFLTFAIEHLRLATSEPIAMTRVRLFDAAGVNVNRAQNVLWSVYEAGR